MKYEAEAKVVMIDLNLNIPPDIVTQHIAPSDVGTAFVLDIRSLPKEGAVTSAAEWTKSAKSKIAHMKDKLGMNQPVFIVWMDNPTPANLSLLQRSGAAPVDMKNAGDAQTLGSVAGIKRMFNTMGTAIGLPNKKAGGIDPT